MDCDQIAARYYVSISGISSTGNRCPSQNQLTAIIIDNPCGSTISYTGGVSYPTSKNISLTGTGTTYTFSFDAKAQPDLYLVYDQSNNLKQNTGYRGSVTLYDFGGGLRNDFKTALNGKSIPIYGGTYPNFTLYPDDGYPRISSSTGSVNILNSPASSYVRVEVYAPLSGTAWDFTISCLF